MSEFSDYQKYLKYKTKYTELKAKIEMDGGLNSLSRLTSATTLKKIDALFEQNDGNVSSLNNGDITDQTLELFFKNIPEIKLYYIENVFSQLLEYAKKKSYQKLSTYLTQPSKKLNNTMVIIEAKLNEDKINESVKKKDARKLAKTELDKKRATKKTATDEYNKEHKQYCSIYKDDDKLECFAAIATDLSKSAASGAASGTASLGKSALSLGKSAFSKLSKPNTASAKVQANEESEASV
jgi:hypothetical protein